MRCQLCSYKLVLLPIRRKYKCAKCSRLFSQKQVEVEAFRKWNQKQREIDTNNAKLEVKEKIAKRKPLLSEVDKVKRRKNYANLYRLRNLEKLRSYERLRYVKNKDLINTRKRQLWVENVALRAKRKIRRQQNIDFTRLQTRLDHWKQQQKFLADEYFENELSEAYSTRIARSVPTFLLCEVLNLSKIL